MKMHLPGLKCYSDKCAFQRHQVCLLGVHCCLKPCSGNPEQISDREEWFQLLHKTVHKLHDSQSPWSEEGSDKQGLCWQKQS